MSRLNILFVNYLTLLLLSGCAQADPGERVVLAFYNCENLFDTVDNPLTNDDDFTPQGKNRYTGSLYHKKLRNIATVLQSMKEPPAIIGLAEVENGNVLADLTRQPEIAGRGYKYILHEGEDGRGINVALLYDARRFKVLGSSIYAVALPDGEKTRGVLTVTGLLDGDTLFVQVNHWPSRRGGEEDSRQKRVVAAQTNKEIVGHTFATQPGARVVIMGDFNDNPADSSIANVLGAAAKKETVSKKGFYNPFAAIYATGQGTAVYRHRWDLFDQIIVSGTLMNGRGLRYEGAEIYKPTFIQSTHKDHKGEPYRSWLGSRWINGYSDHFPVVLYLSKKD